MKTSVVIGTLLVAVVALALSAATVTHAQSVTLGIDANATGNSAANLGSIQDCRSVDTGDTFDVDAFITNVEALTGFEFQVQFDPDILEITGVDDSLLLAATPGSNIISFTESPPGETSGSLAVATADFGDMGTTEESGSGVLARFTFKARSTGTSTISINEPKLVATVGNNPSVAIGPLAEGSQTFIGPVFSANVAVGQSCSPPPPPTPHPALSEGATPAPGTTTTDPETDPGAEPGTDPGTEPDAGQETPGAEDGTPANEDSIQPTPTSGTSTLSETEQGNVDGDGLSTGAWIGIAVGIAAVAMAAAGGGWRLLRRRSKSP